MIMTAVANETFMVYEFHYEDAHELSALLRQLNDLKRNNLIIGDISITTCLHEDNMGYVFACIRSYVVDTLLNRLSDIENIPTAFEVETVNGELKSIF